MVNAGRRLCARQVVRLAPVGNRVLASTLYTSPLTAVSVLSARAIPRHVANWTWSPLPMAWQPCSPAESRLQFPVKIISSLYLNTQTSLLSARPKFSPPFGLSQDMCKNESIQRLNSFFYSIKLVPRINVNTLLLMVSLPSWSFLCAHICSSCSCPSSTNHH